MNKRLVSLLLGLSLITVISVSALPPAFEHTRESLIKTLDSQGVSQSFEYGDKQLYNWNYSNPSDYSFNSTEIEVTGGNAQLLVNTSGSAGIPPFLKILAQEGFVEVLSRRSQTSRHFYNEETKTYRYMSDELVQYSDHWIPFEEYPLRFILRLRNTTVKRFDSVSSIGNYISLIDNSTIWGIGIESFNGILGFYLNFQDAINGHGQYLYYPRLRNGRLPAYNQPLYAIYPHLFAKVGAQWFDQLLNNRSLYSAPQNPRNNLHFTETSDTFELYFQTLDVTIQGFQWDIRQGFKYNKTTRLYHMITEFRCIDRGFDDIGMAYEITASPQSEGTPYEPDRFLLSNETHEVITTVQNAWDVGTYLENFYSEIQIISQNDESFTFTFNDMELAGFTQKYLSLQDLEMPNYETRKALRAGMYGFGSYTQNEWIQIDPTYSEKQIYNELDFDGRHSFPSTYRIDIGSSDMDIGNDGVGQDRRGWITWNTTITEAIASISNVVMTFWMATTTMEANEYTSFNLYYNETLYGGFWNASFADTNETTEEWVWKQEAYYSDHSFFSFQTPQNQNRTMDSTRAQWLLGNWSVNHNLDPANRPYISMWLSNGTDSDSGTDDMVELRESSTPSAGNRPTLTFDYTLLVEIPPELDSPSDKSLPYTFTGETITWIPTERTNGTDNYVVYKNGSIFDSGSWSNQTPIVVDIDSLSGNQGIYNFTIFINDTIGLNASDLVYVTVANPKYYYWTNPTITSLFNFTFNLTLRNFVVNSTVDINSSIKFQLAIDNDFYYWDGLIWDVITIGQNNTWYFENEANDETVINSNINELAEEGNLSVKAFLHNEYNSTPLLDNVFVDTYNLTIPVAGIFHERIKDNSFTNLGFAFDFYTVKAYMDINAYNFTFGNNLTVYFLYVLPYTTDSFINAVILYKLDSVRNITKEIDIPKISLQTLDIENSDKKNTSLIQDYHYRDLIILIETNGKPVFNIYLELELIWYKTDVEIQQDFIKDIFAMDDPLDLPIFLLLMPLLLIFSGDQFGLIAGLTIGIVEIILALGIIRAFRSAI